MTAYLLTWNPERWNWSYLQKSIAEVKTQGSCRDRWGCGATKKIVPGDRVFLMKLGKQPRGIVASGWVTTRVYEDLHWDEMARQRGETTLYIDVRFDTLLDPEIDIFPRAALDSGIYTGMHWEPRASGVTIPGDIAAQLEEDWAQFLKYPTPFRCATIRPEDDRFDEKITLVSDYSVI
jgi:5-methylcytosine-specific restriction protein A